MPLSQPSPPGLDGLHPADPADPGTHAGEPWRPGPAVAATVAILVTAQLLAALAVKLWLTVSAAPPPNPSGSERSGLLVLMIATLASQLIVIALTLLAARTLGRRPAALLRLGPPAGRWRSYASAIALTLCLLISFNAIAYYGLGQDLLRDIDLFRRALASPAWLVTVIVVVIGAPLSEELLFRGFLLPSLAATRLRFLGASLVTTAAWTTLHIGYSAIGIAEVALAGLLFSWLIGVSGSLRVAIAAHAAYNGIILSGIALLRD